MWWVEPEERGRDRKKHGRSLNHSSGHADRGAAWGWGWVVLGQQTQVHEGVHSEKAEEGVSSSSMNEFSKYLWICLTGQPPPGIRCLQLPLGVSPSDTGAVKSQFSLESVSSFTVFLDSQCFSQPL